MNLVALNLTSEPVYLTSETQEKATLIHPVSRSFISIENTRPKWSSHILFSQGNDDSFKPYKLPVDRLKLARKRNWKRVSDEGHGCPWRMYLLRNDVSKASRTFTLIILSNRRLFGFLNDIEDDRALSDLCLPGTHDTMALYGWPVSQCQSTPLSVQLQSGIRVLDVRLAVIDGKLIAYHGAYPQKIPFQAILATIHAFFTSLESSRETLVMSIKQEDFARTPPPYFSELVHAEIESGAGGRDMWFLDNRVPRLGEVRGKVVMFSRFGGDGAGWENGLEGMGIHPTTWPDSQREGFEWRCKNTVVRTHDWYSIPSFLSIPEKVQLATAVLVQPPQHRSTPMLNITYFSAGSFPLALPPTVACGFGWPAWGMGVEGVNSRVVQWLLNQLDRRNADNLNAQLKANSGEQTEETETSIRGWAFMDFYESTSDLVPLFIEFNFLQ